MPLSRSHPVQGVLARDVRYGVAHATVVGPERPGCGAGRFPTQKVLPPMAANEIRQGWPLRRGAKFQGPAVGGARNDFQIWLGQKGNWPAPLSLPEGFTCTRCNRQLLGRHAVNWLSLRYTADSWGMCSNAGGRAVN